MSELLEHLEAELRSIYSGKRWILAFDVYVSANSFVDWLKRLDAEAVLCIAASRGAGEGPDEEFAPNPIIFDTPASTMMASVRAGLALLADLPPDAVRRVDAFDPTRESLVIGPIYDDGRPVAGRSKYGARPAAWQLLEDKTIIDDLWDVIGVPRAEFVVLPANDVDALRDATQAMGPDGAVWAADAKEGFHGGASFTRWVQTEEHVQTTQADFAPHADLIRVMPFLAGVPCSIHGIVYEDYVVALRPCEMLVLRTEDGQFQYARAATFWDPPEEDREMMRELARRVGAYLAETYDYRGAFTLDGVMTAEGFRPTELNPRFGAALGAIGSSLDLHLVMLNLAIVAREPVDWRPAEFEALLLDAADKHRSGGPCLVVSRPVTESLRTRLVFEAGAFREAGPDEPHDAIAKLGPHAAGGYFASAFEPDRTPVGPSCAPRSVDLLRWANEHWSLGLGEFTACPDVRAEAQRVG